MGAYLPEVEIMAEDLGIAYLVYDIKSDSKISNTVIQVWQLHFLHCLQYIQYFHFLHFLQFIHFLQFFLFLLLLLLFIFGQRHR